MVEAGGRRLEAALDLVASLGDVSDVDAFATQSLAGLASLIPCDVASYVQVGSLPGPAVVVQWPAEPAFAPAAELLAHYQDTHPLIRHYRRTGTVAALQFSDLISQHRLHQLGIYHELFKPVGCEHQLAIPLAPVRSNGMMHGYAFMRARGEFTRGERDLLELLRPHLVRLLVATEERVALRALEASLGPAERALVLLGRDLRVTHVTAPAQELLRRWFGGVGGPWLPAQLDAWLRRDPDRLFSTARDGRRLYARLGGAEQSEVVLEEHVDGAGLTQREQQTVRLVADGATNQEAARRLGISPLTVKKHLEHAYAKLGVTSRTAAAAALRDQDFALAGIPDPAGDLATPA